MFPPICAAGALHVCHRRPLYRTICHIIVITFLTTIAFTASALPAQASTYTVNATDDVDDGGTCGMLDAHCTLREAIRNANSNAGPDTINFNIPFMVGNACGPMSLAGGPWCTIQLVGSLPPLLDSGTTINGFSQPDTNSGTVDSIRPGVIDAGNTCPVLQFKKPDIAINGNNVAINIFSIGAAADNIEIRGLSIYNGGPGFDGHAIVGAAAASLATAPQDRDILENFVGVLPDGSDPLIALRNKDFGIRQFSPGYMTIEDNYVGHNGKGGIDAVESQTIVDVKRNEVFENGWRSMSHDGIDINGIDSDCECNYTHHNTNTMNAPRGDSGTGIEIGSKQATAGLDRNVIRYNTVEMNTSAGVSIRKGPRGNLFEKNVVFANWVGFAIDSEGRLPTNRNELSRNSTYQNMSALSGGIDLNATKFVQSPVDPSILLPIDPGAWSGNPDGLTPNDPCDADGGPAPDGDPANTQSNDLQNFPVLNSARAIGNDLRVEGELNSWPERWYRIEFFRTPAGDNVGRGEGKFFIGAIRVFVDASCTATFDRTFAAAGVPAGDEITATATRDENAADSEPVSGPQSFDDVWSTSEYSVPEVVDLFLPEGKVTGGGHIDPVNPVCTGPCDDSGASSTRMNFGFNASYHKDNFDPFGHTNFVYKGGNIHLGSLDYAFASLIVNRDPVTGNGDATWRGSAKVNNKKGFCFDVFVRDLGEPGTTDTFRIRIWANPAAGDSGEACDPPPPGAPFFDSTDQVLSGGNIQIHKLQ